ncbi:MAG: glycosyltransferase [Chloroflexi bacterium]|nr:glycosyltransferase [Chloroflexota bacterium]
MTYRIALVTHTVGGGVWTTTQFLRAALNHTEQYSTDIIVLATSMSDDQSVRLLSPATWQRGIQVGLKQNNNNDKIYHVGAFLTEFEFQRYKPRRQLTELLNRYDLVQVVAGTPAWAAVTEGIVPPVTLFVATRAGNERVSSIRQATGWKKIWMTGMVHAVAQIELRALSLASCVFAESHYTIKLLNSIVPQARLTLAPPGVDTDFFCPPSCYQTDGPLLCVGRLDDPRKNLSMLIRAYHAIHLQRPDIPRLVLVGRNGVSEEDTHLVKSLGLENHIEIKKNISLAQLRLTYQNASLFVLPSDEEGLGIVILEAMASGLPVICTDCGGPSTAIVHGTTGLLTPVGNLGAITDAIQSLLQDSTMRQQMGYAGRTVAEKRFSMAATGQVYLDKYAELLICRAGN